MKKLIGIFLLILMSVFTPEVNASTAGGIETSGQGRFGLGISTVFVIKRDLEHANKEVLSLETISEIEMDGYQILFKPSYGLSDDLDIYGIIGMQEFDVDSKGSVPGFASSTYVDTLERDVAYGVGLKFKYDLREDWVAGVDARYLLAGHEAKSTENYLGNTFSAKYNSAEYEEWQVALLAGRQMKNFSPYAGLKYSELAIELTESPIWVDMRYESDNDLGIFLGLDYDWGGWSSNLEIDLLTETSIGLGTSCQF